MEDSSLGNRNLLSVVVTRWSNQLFKVTSWKLRGQKKKKKNPNQTLLLIVRLRRLAPINTVQLSSQSLTIIQIAVVLEEIKIRIIKAAQLWQFFLPSNQTAHSWSISTHSRNMQSSRLQHYYLYFRADWHSSMESRLLLNPMVSRWTSSSKAKCFSQSPSSGGLLHFRMGM